MTSPESSKSRRLFNGEQDFFLDLIFAPVETAASSSAKNDAETEAGAAAEKEADAEGVVELTPNKDDPTPASPASPPSESNAAFGASDGTEAGAEAAGAGAGAETENSAVARSEFSNAETVFYGR